MYFKSYRTGLLVAAVVGALLLHSGYRKADKVIQIAVASVLNGRSVTTLTNGELVTWTKGLDRQNGYLTTAAALFKGDKDPHALPDDPLIAANEHHPAILLHYDNADGAKYQTRCIPDTGAFTIIVPKNKYKDLYLGLTSAYGTSTLQFDLIYKDGTAQKSFVVPDWFNDIPDTDPDFSYIVHDRDKWGSKNQLTEKNHHNIDALNIHPDPKRVLTAVKVNKLPGGYLLFWSATGVVK